MPRGGSIAAGGEKSRGEEARSDKFTSRRVHHTSSPNSGVEFITHLLPTTASKFISNNGVEFITHLVRLHEAWLTMYSSDLGCDDRASTRWGRGAAEEQEDPQRKRTKTTENVLPQGLVRSYLAPGNWECNDDDESVVFDQVDDQGWNNNRQVCDHHHRVYDQEEDDREKSMDWSWTERKTLSELDTGSKIPPYDPSCCGGPWAWNRPDAQRSWSKKLSREFDSRRGGPRRVAEPNIDTVLAFLHQRRVLDKLCRPVFKGEGWYRLRWKSLPDEEAQKLQRHGWEKAWHGTKIQALFSILFREGFTESSDEDTGERMLGGVPGVYCHKDCQRARTEFYMCFMPLFGDDVFWAAQFELLVDRRRPVPLKRGTDQWASRSDALKITALWMCGRTTEQMKFGDTVTLDGWNPSAEVNPHLGRKEAHRLHSASSTRAARRGNGR